MRKPLVEKKRRARINESLQELRVLMADADLQSKMENAEVLEMTVKRVEGVLQSRAQEVDAVNREACERFAAGYIQCMHDVHTFVSSCPGIDPTVAAELLNHLLESMPLNDEDSLRELLQDTAADCPGNNSTWSESMYAALVSPAPSTASTDDLCSDLDDTYSEQSHVSSSEEADCPDALSLPSSALLQVNVETMVDHVKQSEKAGFYTTLDDLLRCVRVFCGGRPQYMTITLLR